MPKGRDAERQVGDLLEDHGFRVYHPPKAKYRDQDVFGLFDLLAYDPSNYYHLQVKTGDRVRGITDWFDRAKHYEEWAGDVTIGYVHIHPDGWRYAEWNETTYRWVVDERDQDVAAGMDVIDYLTD